MNQGLSSLFLLSRKNDIFKNNYDCKSIRTAGENELIIGQVLYDFIYAAINFIIFHRGLYSKESFTFHQSFGFSIPLINTPDVLKYIRTVTEKIVNFLLSDILEGFAFEECSRRTRERLVLKFHFHGSLNLTPSTFDEFQTSVEELRISCKNLLFDLQRRLRYVDDASSKRQSISFVGKSEKSRKKPKWKIITGLKTQDGINSLWETNKVGVFYDDPDWETFPWKKSKLNVTQFLNTNSNSNNEIYAAGNINNTRDKAESPVNEIGNIIAESDAITSSNGDPCFYYDCQDFMMNEEDDEEYDCSIINDNELDDIRPLSESHDEKFSDRNSTKKRGSWNISNIVESFHEKNKHLERKAAFLHRPINNNNKNGFNDKSNSIISQQSSTSASTVKNYLFQNNENKVEVITIDDNSNHSNNSEDDDNDDDNSSLNISFHTGPFSQEDSAPNNSHSMDIIPATPVYNSIGKNAMDVDCGSPDMFEDPLEIFNDLDEVAVLESKSSDNAFPIKIKKEPEIEEGDKVQISPSPSLFKKSDVVNAIPTSNITTAAVEKQKMKMYSISSVQMTGSLVCNILLLQYPPRIARSRKLKSANDYKNSLRQLIIKKRRVLCFD